jgi:hypothetical protein
MAAKETGFFRGAGGGVFEMDLPLAEPYQYQAARGQLVRVNPDGSSYQAEAVDSDSGPARRPAVNATKNEWVGYAVSQGMAVDDADAMTKAELVERFGEKK